MPRILILLALTALLAAPGAGATFAGANGKIVLTTTRHGMPEIYVMNAAGSNQSRLTFNTAVDIEPAWSPDGTRIVFESGRDGNREIYVMDADGSNQTRLTFNPAADGYPSWSADGTRIAFQSLRDGNFEVYVMNADGSDQQNLTTHPATDNVATWSSRGDKLAFSSDRNGNFELYTVHSDGQALKRLTHDPAADSQPNWSPNGNDLVFTSERDGNLEVYVMHANGRRELRVTETAVRELGPTWSPDGEQIVMTCGVPGALQICVMSTDGTGRHTITTPPGMNIQPDWQAVRWYLVLALGGSAGASAAPAPEVARGPAAAVTACKSGYRHAIIGGRHRCLKAGQRCKRRLDRRYYRYGFHCHTGRLTRKARPKPPPVPPPGPPRANAVKIALGGAPSQFAVGAGSVWVGAHRDYVLFRIDPQTNAVRARIALPFASCGIAVTAAAVWVGHCIFEDRGLSRIDLETNQVVSTIAGVRAADVTAAAGSIWITGATIEGEVWRLDPQTSQFVAKIPVGARPHSTGFGFGNLWVASGGGTTSSSATVARIDPDTNLVVSTIRVGAPGGDIALAVGEGAVWATNSSDKKLYRIDPATSTATAIDVGAGHLGRWYGMSVAVGLGSVWFRTEADVVSRLDPRTNQVVQRMTLGHGTGGAGAPYGGGGLTVGFDSLWATDPEANLLLRIQP